MPVVATSKVSEEREEEECEDDGNIITIAPAKLSNQVSYIAILNKISYRCTFLLVQESQALKKKRDSSCSRDRRRKFGCVFYHRTESIRAWLGWFPKLAFFLSQMEERAGGFKFPIK